MRTTLSSIPFVNPTVEVTDDISVPYRTNALAAREDLASARLRRGESESVVHLGSSSEADKPAKPTYPNAITTSPESRGGDPNEGPTVKIAN